MTTSERDLIREQGICIKELTDTVRGMQGMLVAQAEGQKQLVEGQKQHGEDMKLHNQKHEADMEAIRPIMEGILGIKTVGTFFKWVGGLALMYFAIKAYLT